MKTAGDLGLSDVFGVVMSALIVVVLFMTHGPQWLIYWGLVSVGYQIGKAVS